MRDINDPVVRTIAITAVLCVVRNPTDLFSVIQSAFGEIESWRHIPRDGRIVYDLEAEGKVVVRVQIETEGV